MTKGAFDDYLIGAGIDDIPCLTVKIFRNEEQALNEVETLKEYCHDKNRTLYLVQVVEPALVYLTVKDGEKIGEQIMREYVNTIIRFKDMGEHWADNSEGDNE